MIEVRDLAKQYGKKAALKGISFTVNKGEIVGFLGPNGAGKSTTMQILTGFLSPTRGEVRIGGADLWENPLELKRQIGYLPENPPVYREMTVKEYLKFVMELKGVPKASKQDRLAELVDRLQLQEVYNRLIGNLSKGYRQRVGLAQAISANPEVLILDEPSVGLDPQQIITIREFIRELGRDRTVILSSHILPEVSMLCERVLIINQGEIVAEGTPAELSRKVQQGMRMQIQVKGEPSVVYQALAEIPDIVQIAELPTLFSDRVEYQITTEGTTDVREVLSLTLARAGLAVLEMKVLELSLEDIFLQIVTDEDSDRGIA